MHFTVYSANNLFIHSMSHLFQTLSIEIMLIAKAKKKKKRYGLSVFMKINPEKEVSQEKNI